MDLADITRLSGTLPKSGSVTVAATALIFVEGARTMSSMCGDSRFSHPYGGEMMAASYVGTLATLTCVITKSPLPALGALASIVLFGGLYHWQENLCYGSDT